MVEAGAGAKIFDKPEPEPHKNWPAPQHWLNYYIIKIRTGQEVPYEDP
jgi:hypothetical protein